MAIVGNAAEHWVAVLVARKDKMDLSVNIAIGSSAQVALFVTPVLVLAGFFIGPSPMPLVFNGYELGALLFAVLIASYVSHEGESTWFEGVQLLARLPRDGGGLRLRLTGSRSGASAPSASSTSSSCVFGETLGKTFAIRPSASMMNVARCTPM